MLIANPALWANREVLLVGILNIFNQFLLLFMQFKAQKQLLVFISPSALTHSGTPVDPFLGLYHILPCTSLFTLFTNSFPQNDKITSGQVKHGSELARVMKSIYIRPCYRRMSLSCWKVRIRSDRLSYKYWWSLGSFSGVPEVEGHLDVRCQQSRER